MSEGFDNAYNSTFGSTSGAASSSAAAGGAISFSSITVHDPELRGSNRLNQHYVYKITTDPVAVDHVYRRYSDFDSLHSVLSDMFPGVFVPPLPPKKAFGNMNEDYILGRRRPGLERFLNRVSRIPILAESAIFQMFVVRAHGFEESMKEAKKAADGRTVQAILAAYQQYYADVLAAPAPMAVEQELTAMEDFFKGEEERLAQMASHTHDLAGLQTKSVAALNKVASVLQTVYNHERGSAVATPPRAPFLEHFAQWHVDAKEFESAYTHFLQNTFMDETADAKQMLALLALRSNLKSRHDKSKAKANKWADPSTKCDSDKHRAAREADLRKEEEEALLLEAVTKLLANVEVKQAWLKRVGEWEHNMLAWARSQSQFAQRSYQNWESMATKGGADAAGANPEN
jgi:hypothetical protein